MPAQFVNFNCDLCINKLNFQQPYFLVQNFRTLELENDNFVLLLFLKD